MVHHVGGINSAEGAVAEAHVFRSSRRESLLSTSRAGSTHSALRTPFQRNVAQDRSVGAFPRVIKKINSQHCLGDAADKQVAQKDVFDHAAAPGVRLEAQRAIEIRLSIRQFSTKTLRQSPEISLPITTPPCPSFMLQLRMTMFSEGTCTRRPSASRPLLMAMQSSPVSVVNQP